MKKLNSIIRQPQPSVAGLASALAIGTLWAVCASTSIAAGTNLEKLPAVKAFYAETAHCMYMVDNPAEASDSVTNRYAKAADAAVSAMRQAQPSLSLDNALLQLREGCESVLQR